MNPVGRDQYVAPCSHGLLRTVAPDEGRGDPMLILREIVQLMGCMNMVFTDPCPCRRIEHPLQLTPVHGQRPADKLRAPKATVNFIGLLGITHGFRAVTMLQ